MEIYLPNDYMLKNKYKILEGIFSGDFSNIYIVEYGNKKYILKEYFPKKFSIRIKNMSIFTEKNKYLFEKMKINFFNEIHNLKRLKKRDGIVEIFDSFNENNTEYILMEYCVGINLKEYIINTKNMSMNDIIRIFLKILKVINKIHGENIVHLDIKPSNIFIDQYENIKIIDFGSSIKLKSNSHYKKGLKIKYFSNEIIVSNGYSALELYSREKNLDKRSDIYSLFCVLYFMFSKKNPISSIKRFLEDPLKVEDIFFKYSNNNGNVEINKQIDDRYYKLLEMVQRGLAIKKEERYRNIGEIIYILEKLF